MLLDAVSELSGLQSSAARLVASRAALAVTGEWALSSSPMWIKVSDEFIEVSSRFKTVRLKIEIACSETAATSFRNLDLNLDSALSDLQDTAKMVKGVADFQKAIPGLLKVVRQELRDVIWPMGRSESGTDLGAPVLTIAGSTAGAVSAASLQSAVR